MPVTESRFIDFERRKNELLEYEKIIWKYSRENNAFDNADSLDGLQMNIEVSMDTKASAYETSEHVPSATATISLSGFKASAQVIFQGDIFTQQTNFSMNPSKFGFSSLQNNKACLADGGVLTFTIFCKDTPCLDLRCQLLAITNSSEMQTREMRIPMKLVCRAVNAQRTSNFKLSLGTENLPTLNMSQLFPEFESEHSTSIGFQPYFLDAITSIYASTSNFCTFF